MAADGSRLGPIHSLPIEILVNILLMHTSACHIGLASYDKHHPHPRRASDWTSLMLVCRQWRDVALATHTLWQVVDVWSTTTWLKLALDRSCNAPLELYFHVCDVVPDSIPLIVAQAHRLRKLLLRLPRFKRSDFPALKILFQTAMPVLDELRVHLNTREIEAVTTRITIDSLETSFPSLRTIRLENFVIPWALPALSRMRCLTLRNCVALNSDLTFEQFLDTLEACTELEDLRLHGFVSTIAHRVPAGFARTVRLPRLRKLSISEPPALCRQLLSVLHLSPTLILRVIGVLDPTSDILNAQSLFPSMLPEDLSKLPIIPSLKHATIEDDNDVTLQLWSNLNFSDERGSITLKLDSEQYTDAYMPHAIEDFVHLFSSAPLERVYVSFPRRSVPARATWEALFAALPAVRSLSITPGWTLELVCDALGGQQPVPLLGVDDAAARASSPGLLPSLCSLRLEDVEWSEDAMDYVLGSLLCRARSGLPQLDELSVQFMGMYDMKGEKVREEVARELSFYKESMEEFAKRFVWGWS